MSVLFWIVAAALGAQSIILLANLWHQRRRPLPAPGAAVRLSVLIPARNELSRLPRLLDSLSRQSYGPAEVVVCDDGSEDGTTQWLERNAEDYGVRWLRAAARPEGWTGKNWACHQLAQRAGGDWLLFLDADLEPELDFLAAMAGLCADSEATLVTGLPRIHPGGLGNGLLTAMVPFAVLTLLPLTWAERHPNPGFAFANGQVLALRREDYRRLDPHRAVRSAVLDDVELARHVKLSGGTVRLAPLGPHLAAAMYRTTSEALAGFAKNAVPICRGKLRATLMGAALALVHLVPLGLALSGSAAWWPLVAWSALLYGLPAVRSGLPAWYALLFPVAVVLGEAALARSLVWHLRRRVIWKGRIYPGP